MSEYPRSARIGAGLVAGLLAAGLMSGCSAEAASQSHAVEIPDATAVRGDIPLCYPDMPAAKIQRKIAESYEDASAHGAKPITIHQDAGKSAEGYTGKMPKKISKKVGGAAVKVTFDGYTGSGFVVLDPKGKEVVVTAAHVIAPENTTKKSEIELTDRNGTTAKVKSACYVNGTGGRDSPPGDSSGEHIDLAILRPTKELGTTALTLAKHPPKRGEVVGFYNFQQGRPVSEPANYSGIAMDLRTGSMSNTILTGLGKENDDIIDNAVVPGASGSAAVDYDNGDVFGVTVSVRRVDYQDMSQFGVKYEQDHAAYNGTDTASVAGIVDAADLQYALAGGRY